MKKKIVIALGGNAIINEGESGDIYQQFANTRRSLEGVVELISEGFQIVLTHGNGPQVGNYLIRVEEASHIVPTLPLGIIVADTQGGIGYMIMQQLKNKLRAANLKNDISTVVTQVVVNPEDPSIKNPSKFVGPFYQQEDVEKLVNERGWIIKEDPGRGYRRVVPSPKPLDIVEKNIIRDLVEKNYTVIACGGGGIPVYYDEDGNLEGVDAVIDKDLASAILGNQIEADELLILTGVDKVYINFRQPDEKALERMTLAEARRYLAEGQFPAGSMGPKIQAAINFLEGGGKRVVISSIENSAKAAKGLAGTIIEN